MKEVKSSTAVPKLTQFRIASLITMKIQIDHWITETSQSLDAEECRDNPRDARLDMLNTRIDGLQAAYDALEGIDE